MDAGLQIKRIREGVMALSLSPESPSKFQKEAREGLKNLSKGLGIFPPSILFNVPNRNFRAKWKIEALEIEMEVSWIKNLGKWGPVECQF